MEDLAHIGFWKLATLMPHDLSVKLDRLTIGILPVKMKAIYCFGAAGWMHLLMKLMKPFMSKKMRDRMILVNEKTTDIQDFCEQIVGGRSNIPIDTGFANGQLVGDAPRDAVVEKFLK
jgi:CRAL/TRIO domain